MATTETAKAFDKQITIGELGTQLFWLNKSTISKKFEYAFPVQTGGEFGGDTESFEAKETDLDYVPKIAGRSSINDIQYTLNYTIDRYKRLIEVIDNTEPNTYMEVFSDGSAVMFTATVGRPTITSGDTKSINANFVCQNQQWIENVNSITTEEIAKIQPMVVDAEGTDITLTASQPLPFDLDTIPDSRKQWFVGQTQE